MTKFKLSRRTMVRGIVGGGAIALALPPLEAMFDNNGRAYADNTPIPKRFGVFFWGNGVKQDRWIPSNTGVGWTPSPALESLAGVRDYVSVVSGMNIAQGGRAHHAGTVGILSGAPLVAQPSMGGPYCSTFSAPSIDQVVASALGNVTRFRSLEVGVSPAIVMNEGTTLRCLSHNGPDNVNPPMYSPRDVFMRVFGDGFVAPGTEPMIDPRLGLRRSILDAVMADARALQLRVGSADRMRLDQHFESVRSLERQIAILEEARPVPPPASCALPMMPGDFDLNDLAGISHAMSDLLAMALACDQTRVFSNMFSGSVSLAVYRGIGSDTVHHHNLTHDEPGDQPLVHNITCFIMAQFAYMLEALRSVPEGDGNLLDHCAILASTDTGEGVSHSITDFPILVAGRANGALRGGVHHRAVGDNTSKVLFTLLHAMDIPVDEFGVGLGRVTSGVDEIAS
jgi:hypothetical protein